MHFQVMLVFGKNPWIIGFPSVNLNPQSQEEGRMCVKQNM